jgi:hypothetical protein
MKINFLTNPTQSNKPKAFALSIVMVITLVLALLATLLIAIVVSEYKITKSQESGTAAFYIAEAGTEETIWLVQNNPTYKTHLEQGTFDANNGDFAHNPGLTANSRYEVNIRSTDRGAADVTATGYYTLGSQTSKRTIKTKIFKALNPSPVADSNIFTADDIDIFMSRMNIINGGIFSNQDIDVGLIPHDGTLVNVDGPANAVEDIHIVHEGIFVASEYHAENYPPAPDPVDFPMVDFTDYQTRANQVYTKEQFEDLMWANQNLTINNDITYITMAPTNTLKIRGNQTLTINGLIVIDGSIDVGGQLCWKGGAGSPRCGLDNISINHTVGKPSGIIVRGDVEFSLWAGSVNVQGLFYGMDEIRITSLPHQFDIVGGLIGRRFLCISLWQGINITYDDEIIRTGLGAPEFSPVVQIEHWEEQY